eukprot:TRINITY_DN293_c1_g1_i5.p1 TRINITY_DN293_c1_g1~~TRINITY_DN293_c1_g1_i5.p1  ORF type:complete len:1128 (+),score=207.95 TRINITY_DN293_c1_g1_i5:84-3467(+)
MTQWQLPIPCLTLAADVLRHAVAGMRSRPEDDDGFDFPADENFWRCLQRMVRVIPEAQKDPTFLVERSEGGAGLQVNRAFLRAFQAAWQQHFPVLLTVAARRGESVQTAVLSANDAVWHELLLRADAQGAPAGNEVPDGKVFVHSSVAERRGEGYVQMDYPAWAEVCRLWPMHYGPPDLLSARSPKAGSSAVSGVPPAQTSVRGLGGVSAPASAPGLSGLGSTVMRGPDSGSPSAEAAAAAAAAARALPSRRSLAQHPGQSGAGPAEGRRFLPQSEPPGPQAEQRRRSGCSEVLLTQPPPARLVQPVDEPPPHSGQLPARAAGTEPRPQAAPDWYTPPSPHPSQHPPPQQPQQDALRPPQQQCPPPSPAYPDPSPCFASRAPQWASPERPPPVAELHSLGPGDGLVRISDSLDRLVQAQQEAQHQRRLLQIHSARAQAWRDAQNSVPGYVAEALAPPAAADPPAARKSGHHAPKRRRRRSRPHHLRPSATAPPYQPEPQPELQPPRSQLAAVPPAAAPLPLHAPAFPLLESVPSTMTVSLRSAGAALRSGVTGSRPALGPHVVQPSAAVASTATGPDDLVWDPRYSSAGRPRIGREAPLGVAGPVLQSYAARYAVPPLDARGADATPCTPRSLQGAAPAPLDGPPQPAAGPAALFYETVSRLASEGGEGRKSTPGGSRCGSITRCVLQPPEAAGDAAGGLAVDPAAVAQVAQDAQQAGEHGQLQQPQQATLLLELADGSKTALAVPPALVQQLLALAGRGQAGDAPVQREASVLTQHAADEFLGSPPRAGSDSGVDEPPGTAGARAHLSLVPMLVEHWRPEQPAPQTPGSGGGCVLTLDMDFGRFVPQHFSADLAAALGLSPQQVAVFSARSCAGSVVVAFHIVGGDGSARAASECARRCQDRSDPIHERFGPGQRCGAIVAAAAEADASRSPPAERPGDGGLPPPPPSGGLGLEAAAARSLQSPPPEAAAASSAARAVCSLRQRHAASPPRLADDPALWPAAPTGPSSTATSVSLPSAISLGLRQQQPQQQPEHGRQPPPEPPQPGFQAGAPAPGQCTPAEASAAASDTTPPSFMGSSRPSASGAPRADAPSPQVRRAAPLGPDMLRAAAAAAAAQPRRGPLGPAR